MKFFPKAIAWAVLLCLTAMVTVAQTSSSAKKKVTPSGKKRPSAARKTGAKKKGTTAAASSRQSWRNRQLQPTEQRYKEIQAALLSKGYLHGEPQGTWNQESVEALRRFQQDQKLEPTGKIDSLSLIALGLGPKHETAKAMPQPGGTSVSPARN